MVPTINSVRWLRSESRGVFGSGSRLQPTLDGFGELYVKIEVVRAGIRHGGGQEEEIEEMLASGSKSTRMGHGHARGRVHNSDHVSDLLTAFHFCRGRWDAHTDMTISERR